MGLHKDIADLLQEVDQFLTSLPPLSPSSDAQRNALLVRLRGLTTTPHGLAGGEKQSGCGTIPATSPATSSVVIPATLVLDPTQPVRRRSGSLSSRSSSGSYTSTSYTSTSYTSNGYGSYEGANTAPLQEDIYEEFDAVQLRIGNANVASVTPVTDSSTPPNKATSKSSTTAGTPFLNHLRNSLSYSKKDKKLHLIKDNEASRQNETNVKSDKLSKKDKKSKDKKSKNCHDGNTDNNIVGAEDKSDVGFTTEVCDEEHEQDDHVGQELVDRSGPEAGEEDPEGSTYMEGLQPVSFSSAITSCDRHGVLHKKTKTLLRSWRPYYCVVTAGLLFLYNKETDQRQRKSIELWPLDVRAATGEEAQQLCLELVAPARKTHTFLARSANDRDNWILAMGQHTKNTVLLPVHPSATDAAVPAVSETPALNTTPFNTAEYLKDVATKDAPISTCEDDTLSTTGSQDDTFSSDEMYEVVNIDDLRSASGPSLSEMLEPHLFLSSDLSSYYTVPDDLKEKSLINISTSTPNKTFEESLSSSTKGDKPARPPPPVLTPERPLKNTSALHHKISPGNALLNALSGIAGSPSKFSLSKGNPMLTCKKLSFPSISRPLPATPSKLPVEEGEIYCEIEDEDYYEESDIDGVHLLNVNNTDVQNVKIKTVPISELPPPLPSRGPPPVPNIENIIAKNNSILIEYPNLFEDYDIPGDLESMNITSAKNTSLIFNLNSSMPQDSSDMLPRFSATSKAPPVVDKSSHHTILSEDVDNDVYKVPTSPLLEEDLYQVPAPIPIPVNNNYVSGYTTQSSHCAVDTVESSDVYQTPTSDAVPVTNNITSPNRALNVNVSNNNNILKYDNSHNKIEQKNSSRKIDYNTSNISEKNINENTKANESITAPGATSSLMSASLLFNKNNKSSKNISVKERIALLNNKDTDGQETFISSSIKSSEDLVVLVDNKEICLDQAKKKAFLESTLNFNAKTPVNT